MKQIKAIAFLVTLAVFALGIAGCASGGNILDRENAATGAGFKIIVPKTPAQMAILQKLPVGKVTRIMQGGKTYYVLPDLANHRAYVGGPKQYQAYQQFRRTQQLNAENYQQPVEVVEVIETSPVMWSDWDGWGSPEGMDGLAEPGWY